MPAARTLHAERRRSRASDVPDRLLGLQRTVGNAAVSALVGRQAVPQTQAPPSGSRTHRRVNIDYLIARIDENPLPPKDRETLEYQVGFLMDLNTRELLDTLEELHARGYLVATLTRVRRVNYSELYTTFWAGDAAVAWVRVYTKMGWTAMAGPVAKTIAAARPADQAVILDYLARHAPPGKEAELMRESVEAMMEATGDGTAVKTDVPNLSGAAAAGVTKRPPSINPRPFQPPKNTPYVGMYIGSEAHDSIAHIYDDAHPGDVTFYNRRSMSTILGAAGRMGKATTPLPSHQAGLEPDITNLTRNHLYEIKPVRSLAQAVAEAKMYQGLFKAAGISIDLGPPGEDGTQGAVGAPNGVYIFDSPVPGAIVYAYRSGQYLRPERVPVTADEPATERWRYVLKPWQKAAIATGLTLGLMLIVMALMLVTAWGFRCCFPR